MQYIWLIPLLPAIGAVINGLIGIRSFSRKTAGGVAILMMAAALGVSLLAFWQLLGLPADARAYNVNIADWIPAIPLQTHSGIGRLQTPPAYEETRRRSRTPLWGSMRWDTARVARALRWSGCCNPLPDCWRSATDR